MSVPKWALIRDDNNKTSSIVKTKNLPSNNPSIRIVSLSSIILPHSKVAKPLKPIIVFDCYCFIALSVSGKKSALESDENTDLSSCSSDDEDTSFVRKHLQRNQTKSERQQVKGASTKAITNRINTPVSVCYIILYCIFQFRQCKTRQHHEFWRPS